MDLRYPATLEAQPDGRYLVQFIDLPDTFTEGETLEEALSNASEVLSVMLAWHLDENHSIPLPGPRPESGALIAPDAKTQAALLIRLLRGERSLADIARAMETSWPAVQRLEDPRHWPSLRTLERAAAALGKRLVLSLE